MTIKDVAKVQWAITKLDITARNNGAYLHRWIFEENTEMQPVGIWRDVSGGKLSLVPVKINAHGDRKANGQPEMGWGLKEETVPAELLNAEITHLNMNCRDGITYTVSVDVEIPMLAWELLKEGLG